MTIPHVELRTVTLDPDLVYDPRARLDGAGHYDDFKVNRVAEIALRPLHKQSQARMRDVLLGLGQLYEALRARDLPASGLI